MSDNQAIIVPRISTFPAHEAKARMILRWLAERRIVEALSQPYEIDGQQVFRTTVETIDNPTAQAAPVATATPSPSPTATP